MRLWRSLLWIPLAISVAGTASAATWRVDRTDDAPAATTCDDDVPNDCSLRGAVTNANGAVEPSTIELPPGTYPLTASSSCTRRSAGFPFPSTDTLPSLCLTKRTTIRGAGAAVTSIHGGNATRLVYVDLDAHVEIEGVALRNGTVTGSFAYGAAVWNDGALALRNVSVIANTAEASGGGLYSGGSLAVSGSLFEGNVAREGGAVWVQGPSTFEDSRFTDNAGGSGGALGLTRSTLAGSLPVPVSMSGCLVDANRSTLGAILTIGADVVILNTTVSGNVVFGGASGLGSGIRASSGTLVLGNVTITDNEGRFIGGGLSILSAAVRIRNTLIAANRVLDGGPTDCLAPAESPVVSEGHNLLQDPVGCSITGQATGDVVGQPALLGALAENGGPTLTHAPAPGSPALEAGSPALPGSGGSACAATDQRGFLRPEGARCDIGALEKPTGFAVVGVTPRRGGNVGSISLRAFGSAFDPDATVRLVRAGEPSVSGTATRVDLGGSAIAASFDLTGRTPGNWDLVVENSEGATATLPAAFTVEAGGGPDVWIDITGRAFLRTLRSSTLVVHIGNRGNVDALGVPVSLSFPNDMRVQLDGDIADPPVQPGQVFEDWSAVPLHLAVAAAPDTFHVPLLLSNVPAGTTLSVRLDIVLTGFDPRVVYASVGTPTFQDEVDGATTVGDRVDAALALIESVAGLPIPDVVRPQVRTDVASYVTAQRETIRTEAAANPTHILGAPARFYSETQLQIDAAFFAATRAMELLMQLSAADTAQGVAGEGLHLAAQALGRWLVTLGPTSACAAISGQKCPPKGRAGVLSVGTYSGKGCEGTTGPEEIGPTGAPPRPTCFEPLYKMINPLSSLEERQQGRRDLGECVPGVNECESLPDHEILLVAGQPICVPKDKDHCKIKCQPFAIRPVVSFDPNEKTGPVGKGNAHFVGERTPFPYTVFFENLETATAPAQEVVVTDALDVARLDVSTFSLGPITFGTHTLIPATGVNTWSGGVDLRPEHPLVVSVEAGLDEATGVVTWRFRSLDPDTLASTDDPLAGFLSPNVTPPEGDGSVSFTITPKADVADGDAICNDASIVFDINAPIVTPAYCNTLDRTPPESHVEPLPLLSPAEPFLVRWTSMDAGSGIAGTTVFVSVNGGPYEVFVDVGHDTTSAEFTPEPGKLYAFYSVAVDGTGRTEAPPASADAETTTAGAGGHDFAIVSVKAPRRVGLSAKRPMRSATIKVLIQNRSAHAETIATAELLRAVASVQVTSLGACPNAAPVLREAPLAKKLPLTLKPKKTQALTYDVRFDCANDPSAATPDYEITARVHHLPLGSADAHPQDDSCPRPGSPRGEVDPFPDGKIKDRGCGPKLPNGQRGGAILVDVKRR